MGRYGKDFFKGMLRIIGMVATKQKTARLFKSRPITIDPPTKSNDFSIIPITKNIRNVISNFFIAKT
jgi:hypothetical protein